MSKDMVGKLLFKIHDIERDQYFCIGVLLSVEEDTQIGNVSHDTYMSKYLGLFDSKIRCVRMQHARLTSFFVLDDNNELKRWHE